VTAKINIIKISMQEKITQTTGSNSEHKRSKNKHLSALNKQKISQNSKDSVIVNCQ